MSLVYAHICGDIELDYPGIKFLKATPDEIIHNMMEIVVTPGKESIKFLTYYLATWRYLNKDSPLRKRKIHVLNLHGYFDIFIAYQRQYRQNLPDEKRPEAKEWFIFPNCTIDDFYTLHTSTDTLYSCLESSKLIKYKENFDTASTVEISKIYDEINKEILSNDNLTDNLVYVAAAAGGWTSYDELARNLGKNIAESGEILVTGGPDGSRTNNGPIKECARGYARNCGRQQCAFYSANIHARTNLEQLSEFGDGLITKVFQTEATKQQYIRAFVKKMYVLPGAIGTESEVLAAKFLGIPCELIGDYWDSFKHILTVYDI